MNDILFLPTRYFPSISGAEFYFQRIAEILTFRFNYNVDIFTSDAIDFKALRDPRGKVVKKNNKHYGVVNNLKINRFSVNYNTSEDEALKNLKMIPSFKSLNLSDDCVKSFIKNGPYLGDLIDYFINDPDLNYKLIHTTFFPYFNLILSLMVGMQNNIPKICTPFFHFSNPRYMDLKLIDVLKKFDLLIACTNIEKQILINEFKIPKGKIIVIPMGVDYQRFKRVHISTYNNYFFKKNYFDKKEINYKLVLFCGHKNFEKGAISILKAIPFILQKIKKIYFVFIGPSTRAFNHEFSKIHRYKDVRIINLTPDNLSGYYDKKKLTAFKEADVYLMPSRTDAFGISFLEAWAAGNPVIGARIGATPEVIEENIDGLLVEFNDPKDIAQKVIVLLKNKKLRRRLGLNGQSKVSQRYTWDIIARQTHFTYQSLINNYK